MFVRSEFCAPAYWVWRVDIAYQVSHIPGTYHTMSPRNTTYYIYLQEIQDLKCFRQDGREVKNTEQFFFSAKLWVINVEGHAAHCQMAREILITQNITYYEDHRVITTRSYNTFHHMFYFRYFLCTHIIRFSVHELALCFVRVPGTRVPALPGYIFLAKRQPTTGMGNISEEIRVPGYLAEYKSTTQICMPTMKMCEPQPPMLYEFTSNNSDLKKVVTFGMNDGSSKWLTFRMGLLYEIDPNSQLFLPIKAQNFELFI